MGPRHIMIKNSTIWSIYKFVCFVAMLESFGAWFFWNINALIVPFLLFGVTIAILLLQPNVLGKASIAWFGIYSMAYLLTIFTQGIPNLNGLINIILKLLPLLFVFSLKEEYKHDCLLFFKKGLSIILAVSLFFWVLYLLGIPLPHSTIAHGQMSEGGGYQYHYINYYFFLRISDGIFSILPRFYSIFIEPGYLGCLMTILLFNGQYKLGKKYRENIVFLLTLLFTFSLAGWLLSLFGLILSKIVASKNKALWLVTIAVFVLIFVSFAKKYNGGDNVLNTYVVSRLAVDETAGIVGNHRVSANVQYEFWHNFIKSDSLLFGGVDVSMFTSLFDASNEVTAYAYIMRNGLLAFVLLVWYFFYPSYIARCHKFDLFLLSLIVFLIFAQTIHMTHSFMYISLLVFCSNEIENYRDEKQD